MKASSLGAFALLALLATARPPGLVAEPATSARAVIAADAARVARERGDVELAVERRMPGRKSVLDALFAKPLPLLRLWEAHRFSPRYKAKALPDGGIHVDDPTGVAADLHLLEAAPGAAAPGTAAPGAAAPGELKPISGEAAARYLAYGVATHRLAPPFRGKALVVLSTAALDPGCVLRIEVRLRMDNRVAGFLARLFYPLVRKLVTRRIDSNLTDLGVILAGLDADPEAEAARLAPADAEALREALGLR